MSHLNLDQLGVPTKLKCIQLHNGSWAWYISSTNYFQEAVRICKDYVTKHLSKGYKLPKRTENSFKSGYFHKVDVSLVLGPDEASYYQFLIGVVTWIIKIGRININTKVSVLSSHSAMPRQGHLLVALHIMGYLKLRQNSRLAFFLLCPDKDKDHSTF